MFGLGVLALFAYLFGSTWWHRRRHGDERDVPHDGRGVPDLPEEHK